MHLSNRRLNPVQPAPTKPLEETDLAGFPPLYVLLAIQKIFQHPSWLTIIVTRIATFSIPVVAPVDSIHIDMRISSILQGMTAPFSMCTCFCPLMVPGERLDASQSFYDLFYAPDSSASTSQ